MMDDSIVSCDACGSPELDEKVVTCPKCGRDCCRDCIQGEGHECWRCAEEEGMTMADETEGVARELAWSIIGDREITTGTFPRDGGIHDPAVRLVPETIVWEWDRENRKRGAIVEGPIVHWGASDLSAVKLHAEKLVEIQGYADLVQMGFKPIPRPVEDD